MKKINVIGETYGQLTVISDFNKSNGYRDVSWCVARCTCGNTTEVRVTAIRSGRTTSCGCLRKKVTGNMSRIHGGTGTRLYGIWKNMRNRCNNPNNPKYMDYGGRSISICSEWNDFEVFKQWSVVNGYTLDLEIDRINNDLGYKPDNCRWTSKNINSRNRRSKKDSSSKYVGVSLHVTSNCWVAYLYVNGTHKHLGIFTTELEAAQARDNYVISNNLEGFIINL